MITDLSKTIAPKSDQLNADDLIGGSRTITVTAVSLCSEADQPIAINFEGDGGKPYKPCKSMRRVLVHVWGRDGAGYVGRSMTIFRDEGVKFGGMAVGGIRISHMSNLDKEVTMALTATRASRKPYVVKPIAVAKKPAPVATPVAAAPVVDNAALVTEAHAAAERGRDTLKAFWGRLTKPQKEALRPLVDTLGQIADRKDNEPPAPEVELNEFGLPVIAGLDDSSLENRLGD